MIVVLVSSAVLGAFLVLSDMKAGGMQESWSFAENDMANNPANMSLMYQGDDGTIYAFETQSYYPNYFMAFDPSGKLKWRTGVNAQPYPVQGADGGFYYVDWPYITVWMDDNSKGGWYNLTSLDSMGNYRWSYVVDNGTLSILATYDDGSVIANHYVSEYDADAGTYVTLLDTIIKISNNGTELWQIDRPLPGLTFQDPRVSPNGTFLVNAYDNGGTYQLGINSEGTEFYIIQAGFVPGYTPGPFSTKDEVQYEVRREYTDNQTSVVNVIATNMSDGGQRWKTVLTYAGNQDDFITGYWVGQDTYVDNDGIIYCGDIVGNSTYALNPDGGIKWERPYMGVIWATYPDGGFLVSDATSISRVGQEGSTVWTYVVGPFSSDYSRILLAPDETVYYSIGTTIASLDRPGNIGGNGIILIILVVFDLIVLGFYGRSVWKRRNSRKAREKSIQSKKKKGKKN